MVKDYKKICSQRGFTLIEILIASLILSSVFFAILKIISNNHTQINLLRQSKTMDHLFLSSKACIQSFGYNTVTQITQTQSLNFGPDNLWCFTGAYNTNLSFTGITFRNTYDSEWVDTTYWSYFWGEKINNTLKIYSSITTNTETRMYDFVMP
jgi:prepilin-type N-terminal cleavage/methylation domain-containing protein